MYVMYMAASLEGFSASASQPIWLFDATINSSSASQSFRGGVREQPRDQECTGERVQGFEEQADNKLYHQECHVLSSTLDKQIVTCNQIGHVAI